MSSHYQGDGGALTITSQIKNSMVTLQSCTFHNNSAIKGTGTSMGRGGGLYAEANSLQLNIKDSFFIDNKANDLGLALYVTQGVTISLTKCNFEYAVDPIDPMQQELVFVAGTISNFDGNFKVAKNKPDEYEGPINVLYLNSGKELNIQVECPVWYNHITEFTSITAGSGQSIQDVSYGCKPCSDNYYTTTTTSNLLSYGGNGNNVIQGETAENCLECPYGAVCTGNNVIPRPNYWGLWHEGQLVFQQCPAGYCCSGSDSSTCSVYDFCAGNKTGILCGSCQDGFSVAILTGSCTPDTQCGEDQWFWLIALLTTAAYALWYTFKDDIFALFFAIIKLIKNLLKNICHVSKSRRRHSIVPMNIIAAKRENTFPETYQHDKAETLPDEPPSYELDSSKTNVFPSDPPD